MKITIELDLDGKTGSEQWEELHNAASAIDAVLQTGIEPTFEVKTAANRPNFQIHPNIPGVIGGTGSIRASDPSVYVTSTSTVPEQVDERIRRAGDARTAGLY